MPPEDEHLYRLLALIPNYAEFVKYWIRLINGHWLDDHPNKNAIYNAAVWRALKDAEKELSRFDCPVSEEIEKRYVQKAAQSVALFMRRRRIQEQG